jgi:eukaryotic-like serine/threonine-protein kinase
MAEELKTLGRYNIERTLGKGAMGVVYEGLDPKLNRRVAIKTILKSHLDPDTAKDYSMRFSREAQAVARLNHPHIVQVYDFAEEGDIAYLVMEFIRGKELKNFFDANERFDIREAVRIMCELLDALDFAHNAGIIHRDIKPANVMLDSQARTKLTDFGVARVQDVDRTHAERTQAGTMVGTPAYMSPEQITGANIDKRTDVFSAGIILYQFLTGEKPFTGGGAWTIAKKIIQEDPPLPSSLNNAVTPFFDAVVNKALSKNPETRYQSAKDFAVGLKRALEGRGEEDDSDKTVVGEMSIPPIARSAPQPRPAAAVEGRGTTSGTQNSSQEIELEFWRAIKDGNDPDDFDLYVQQFPTGIYAALAKRKIAKLRGVAPEETSGKAKEQEKKEAEEAARREAEVKAKLEAEKARLEAEMARKEEEYKKREAEADAKRQAAEKARAEADAKAREEAEKARLEAIEKAKQEAEKAKQEAAAELTKREAEYKKREAEAEAKRQAAEKTAEEKAKKEAELRAKQEAEAKAKRDAEEQARLEAIEKARRDAEAKAKAEAEAKAKREAEFAKREAELKKRVADAEAAPGARSKKAAAVIATIVSVVVLAIGGIGYYVFAPDDAQQKKMIEAMQRQLEESKKREAELKQAKEREEQARIALEKTRKAEEEAKKSGDLAAQKKLAEERARAEAEQKKLAEITRKSEADAKKQADATKAAQDKAGTADKAKAEKLAAEKAAADRAAAEKAQAARQAQERAAVEQRAVAERAALERAAAAEKAAAERIAAAEKAAAEAAARAAAAEKAAKEKEKLASAAAAAPAGGEALYQQAEALVQQGKGNDAVKIYVRAFRSGSGRAAKRLGDIYDKGLAGVSRDYAESLKWYNAARTMGEDVPMAKSR